MTRYVPLVFTLVGLAVGALALLVLPTGDGRLEYMIQVTDGRALAESAITPALANMGAVRAVTMRNPASDPPKHVVLVSELSQRLRNEDCALGVLAEESPWEGLAGSDSGVKRGIILLAGHPVVVSAILQPLAPLFDASLVMDSSPQVQAALTADDWEGQVSYLLLVDSWEKRNRLLAELKSTPGALPSPDSEMLSPGQKPLLGSTTRRALAAVLICAGLLVMALQLRGLSRAEVASMFGRS